MKAKILVPLLALSISLVAGPALAATLKTGGVYAPGINLKIDGQTKNTGGGNFANSTLDGKKLDYMYCIDLLHNIGLNSSYKTIVTTNGQIATRTEINPINASKIAWLVSTQAKTATTNDLQAGLQAAIWKQVYGNRFELLNTTKVTIKNAYNNYLNLLGNNMAPLNSVLWLDPRGGTKDVNHYQDQVAWGKDFGLNTPIPAAVWLFGSAIAGVMGLAKRKSIQ